MPNSTRVFNQVTCPNITASAQGHLTYEVGYQESDKTFHIRVTRNSGSGFFSVEWSSIVAIQKLLKELNGKGFKVPALVRLFESSGANNHGFLVAVLSVEG